MKNKLGALAMIAVLLTACLANRDGMHKRRKPTSAQGLGIGIGAIGGAMFGASLGDTPEQKAMGAAVLGLVGAGVGAAIGHNIDERDRELINNVSNQALEYAPKGTKVAWRNPDSGHHGYVQPVRTWQPAPNQYCREYMVKIVVEGKEQTGYGQACRRGEQSWEIVSDPIFGGDR